VNSVANVSNLAITHTQIKGKEFMLFNVYTLSLMLSSLAQVRP